TQQTIQDAVNRLTLPSQVQRPTVGRFSFQDIPVLAYTINTSAQGQYSLANLRKDIEKKVVPELKPLSGVNSVVVAGGGERQVKITFDDAKLSDNGVTASSVT